MDKDIQNKIQQAKKAYKQGIKKWNKNVNIYDYTGGGED